MSQFKIENFMRIVLLISVVSCLLFSCGDERNSEERFGEIYYQKSRYEYIEIVKVRDCEYVVWRNSYGSDMEHYEGCQNILHQ